MSMMIIDPVLAFIKAFRLRGDRESLRLAACSRFDTVMVSAAKKKLWESCSSDLRESGLTFQLHRGSEKRTQVSADLDDLITCFDKLDDASKLLEMFCEANDIVNLPPITSDSVTERTNILQLPTSHFFIFLLRVRLYVTI